MIDIEVMQDALEIIKYDSDMIPYAIQERFLSDYTGMRALSHWHEDFEWIYVMEGQMNYEINGEEVLLSAGDVLLVNSKQLHFGYACNQRECHFIVLLLHPELLQCNIAMYQNYVQPVIENRGMNYLLIRSDTEGIEDIVILIEKLVQIRQSEEKMESYGLLGIFYELWEKMRIQIDQREETRQTNDYSEVVLHQLKVDVNAISNRTDNFANPDEGYEYLTDLSIQDMNKIAQDSKSINLSKTIGLNNLQKTDDLVSNLAAKYSNVMTPIRKMNANVQQTPDGLMLNFVGTGEEYEDYNPAVMVAPVAAQMGGYLTQLQSYDEAFRNMDMYMLATPSQSYDGASLERKRGWFRPHATNEKVKLKNGPKVENKAYGSYVGGESEMYNFGHGWSGIFGAYVGYEHSRQEYDEVSIRQNGGKIGVLGMAYKGNFYTGLTLNAGISEAKAHTVYGKEDFTLLMSGIASKTGYNAEFANGKFVIQPNWLMSYSYINTSNYTNAADVRIHSTPLQAIQLQPELKFIGNLEAGCQPYASVAMVWTSMDDTKFRANDVTLPELSVKPYAKYGVGIRKAWDEGYAGFVQTYITDGGRKGVGFQAGFTWEFGGGKNK